MHKNYVIGGINIFASILLALLVGFLLNFHVTAYQNFFSPKFSLEFFLFDPFASRLIVIAMASMVINLVSIAVMFSGFFSEKTLNNTIALSLASILWLLLYISADFSFSAPQFVVMPVLIILLIAVLSRRMSRFVFAVVLISASVLIGGVPVYGSYQEVKCRDLGLAAGNDIVEATASEQELFQKQEISLSLRVQLDCLKDPLWFVD